MDRLFSKIDKFRDEMVETQIRLTSIPALGPQNGGDGEKEKADYVKSLLGSIGFDRIEEYKAPDLRVSCGYRPNIVAILYGENRRKTVWILTHLDIVPPGSRELWRTDPFKAEVKNGKIYGRGVEDNQQEMVASIYAVKALKELKIRPKYNVGLAFVSDEETGSRYGVEYLLSQDIFKKEDIIIAPDGGNSKGTMIEVAEKSLLWLKFTVKGKQFHASVPQKAKNASRIGSQFLLRLDKVLHKRFRKENPLFTPPVSTFEPTRREENVPNVNTIPGQDIFYFDCRILPEYPLKEVIGFIKRETKEAEREFKVKIKLEEVMTTPAPPPTPEDAEVVKLLKSSIKAVYGVRARARGIGGGTVAAFFRKAGYDAVVWSKIDGTAHQPNEYCVIKNMVDDAKVYLHLLTRP